MALDDGVERDVRTGRGVDADCGVDVGCGGTYSPTVGPTDTGAGATRACAVAALCGSVGGVSRRIPTTAITATTAMTPPPTRSPLRGLRPSAPFAVGPPRCRPVTAPKRTAGAGSGLGDTVQGEAIARRFPYPVGAVR
ncbi:hypothetical protein Acsp04_52070 [Actinomadura sp. NBRC 104425]|nr:hypothetical protein Acsp04_52070 [Actinomadura sp. NBRC 104425]